MNAAIESTRTNAFASHLLASDKREWTIKVDGVSFVLVRETPERKSVLAHPSLLVDCVDHWTLFVVNDNAERIEVTRESGMWMTADRTGKRPTVAQHTAFRLDRLMKAARVHVEAIARLTVMLESLMNENDLSKAALKTRKLREDAALALRFHRVLVGRNGYTYSLVAGDAVLIVVPNGWHELTYRVGDTVVHSSYNISYFGEITSISPKTITVLKNNSTHSSRMTHEKFVQYNDEPIDAAFKRNSEWYD
jgi:hypothetical protein